MLIVGGGLADLDQDDEDRAYSLGEINQLRNRSLVFSRLAIGLLAQV
jgi:hypothetical protein